MVNQAAAVAIAIIFAGCCSGIVILEMLVKKDPSAGTLITFAQFVVISIGYSWVLSQPRKIPLLRYAIQMAIFFTVSIINNMAFGFDVPVPLHMIFRSGSLIANVLLGRVILGRRVTRRQLIGTVLVSIGIAVTTLASSSSSSTDGSEDGNIAGSVLESLSSPRRVQGLAMLTLALLMSALLGIVQEATYKQYGKHPMEALFYSHALSLPCFLVVSQDLTSRLSVYVFEKPDLLVLLLLGAITQSVCVMGVFRLTSASNSLTMTLVISLRKFVSLVFSILYFANPFSLQHCIGTVCVFAGTLLYSLPAPTASSAGTAGKTKSD